MGLSELDFWGLTHGQFLALMDRHELARYDRNIYLSSLNRTVFVANFGNEGGTAPKIYEYPTLSTDLPKVEKVPDHQEIIRVFERIFPVKKG